MTLKTPAFVVVASPGGVTTLGTLGPRATTDPQVSPRVGPRE
jgi:hypothetical protein